MPLPEIRQFKPVYISGQKYNRREFQKFLNVTGDWLFLVRYGFTRNTGDDGVITEGGNVWAVDLVEDSERHRVNTIRMYRKIFEIHVIIL